MQHRKDFVVMVKSPLRSLRLIFAAVFCLTVLFSLSVPGMAAEAGVSQTQAVKIYYRDSTDSLVIGLLENGDVLTVNSRQNDFYRIDCYGQTAYIPASQVSWSRNDGVYYVNSSGETAAVSACSPQAWQKIQQTLLSAATAQVGTSYVFGGEAPGGFDCSGLVSYAYRQAGITIPRTADVQLSQGVIVDPRNLQPGDLVFFYGTDGSSSFISHVGLYLGDGNFIHAGTKGGVCIRSLDNDYFSAHFRCARRLLVRKPVQHPDFNQLTFN